MIEYIYVIIGCLKFFYCVFYLIMIRKKNEIKLYCVKLNKFIKKLFFILYSFGLIMWY